MENQSPSDIFLGFIGSLSLEKNELVNLCRILAICGHSYPQKITGLFVIKRTVSKNTKMKALVQSCLFLFHLTISVGLSILKLLTQLCC